MRPRPKPPPTSSLQAPARQWLADRAYLTVVVLIFRELWRSAAMGQKRRSERAPMTSGLPRRTDILSVPRQVSKVPRRDITPVVLAGDSRVKKRAGEQERY